MTLQQYDLRDLVDNILEIDGYKSKMGADKDIVTVAFATKTKESADDLASFIERGYTFVLDADATSGEQADGTYKVFVEMQRDNEVGEQIMELANGVENLTGMGDIKFRYYKEFRSKPLTLEELNGAVPTDPKLYGVDSDILNDLSESMNNYTNFFNKSMVENITMWSDMLTIKKIWADPVAFKFVDFGPTQTTLDNITESFNINDFSEIIFLSKYVGDYNITKYGNKLTFENNEHTLVLERIIL
jgi:hypothetical protein|tara:strand:- start:307 stop:1041 length:735 start_codon:yes stop_codon:yes gene_type:complete